MLIRTIFTILVVMTSSFMTLPLFSQEIKTTTFYVVRHGQTDWNIQKKMQGHVDIPLNETGRAEAASLAVELKDIPFSMCFSSDLQRASETASIITAMSSLPLKTDKRLRERDFGPWEGCLHSEYTSNDGKQEGVESNEAMQERIFQILEQAADQYMGSDILIVTHSGVIRQLIIQTLGLDHSISVAIKNTAVLKLTYANNQWVVTDLQGITLPIEAPL